MSSILDAKFKYVPASKTDIRKTFARIRREQKAEAARLQAQQQTAGRKVQQLKARG